MLRKLWFAAFITALCSLSVSAQILIDMPFIRAGDSIPEPLNEADSALLLVTAAYYGDIDSVRALIDAGFDVSMATEDGVTPLMYAAGGGFLEIAELLVANSADTDAVPLNGITALSSACINNHYDMALFLLQQEANTEIPDNLGITPLMYSASYDLFEITELLLMFGADPHHADLEGATALHAAAIYSQPDITWLLLDYGADINKQDNFGFTPLMMAVQLGRTEIADYLIENNANIHFKTNDGLSVLAIAIANSQPELARILIELGADPKERISYADNLMNLARWEGNEELVSLLGQYNVRPVILPDFRILRVSGNILFNKDDFFNGLKASLEDDKYGLRLSAGWYTRPVRRAVLVEFSPEWYDQLWEHRHLYFGGLRKDISQRHSMSLNEEGLFAGIKLLYSKGRYWGTYSYPEPGWIIVPSAGYFKQGSWWFYEISYEYMDLNIFRKSPHFIRFGAGIRFRFIKDPLIYRITNW